MICPKCGKENAEGKNYCTGCGTPLKAGVGTVGTELPAANDGKKKGGRIAAISIIAAVLVLAVAASLFLILRRANASKFAKQAECLRYVTLSGTTGYVVDGKTVEVEGEYGTAVLSGDGSALYYLEEEKLFSFSGGKTNKCASDVEDILYVSQNGKYVYYRDSDDTVYQYQKGKGGRKVFDGEDGYEMATVSPDGSYCVYGLEDDEDSFDMYLWKDGKREKIDLKDFVPITVSNNGKKMYGFLVKDGKKQLYSYCGGEKKKILSFDDDTDLRGLYVNADLSQLIAVVSTGETYLSVNYGEKIKISDTAVSPNAGVRSGYYGTAKDFRGIVFYAINEEDGNWTFSLSFLDRDCELTTLTEDATGWLTVYEKKLLLYTDEKEDLYSVSLSDPDDEEKIGEDIRSAVFVQKGEYVYTLDGDGVLRLIGNGGSAVLMEDVDRICAVKDGLYVLQNAGQIGESNGNDLYFFSGAKGEKVESEIDSVMTYGNNVVYTVLTETDPEKDPVRDLYLRRGKGKFEKIAEDVIDFDVKRG